jgi:hypothetical protein
MTGRPNGTLYVGLTQEMGKSLEDKLDRARQSRVESTAGSAIGLDSRLLYETPSREGGWGFRKNVIVMPDDLEELNDVVMLNDDVILARMTLR